MRKRALAIILSMLMAVSTPALARELVVDEEIAVSETQMVERGAAQEVISTEEISGDIVIDKEAPGEAIFEEKVPLKIAEAAIAEEETLDGKLFEEEPVEDSLILEDIFEEEFMEEPIASIIEEVPAEQIDVVPSEEEGVFEKDEPEVVSATSGQCGDNAYCTLSDDGTLTISGTGDMWDSGSLPWDGKVQEINEIIIEPGITSIGDHAFNECRALASVKIGNSVKSIGEWAFNNCKALPSMMIPDSVTNIKERAFCGCDSLTNVRISKNITCIEKGTFYDCVALTSVIIPNSVTSIGDYAFDSCDSLSSVSIPQSVTSIGRCAFYSCDVLPEVIIPDSVVSIGESAFRYCYALTNVTIGQNVTSIDYSAFNYCRNLKSVTIGSGITTIGDAVFNKCNVLADGDVYYSGTEGQWKNIMIGSSNEPLLKAAIHYNSTGPSAIKTKITLDKSKYEATYGTEFTVKATVTTDPEKFLTDYENNKFLWNLSEKDSSGSTESYAHFEKGSVADKGNGVYEVSTKVRIDKTGTFTINANYNGIDAESEAEVKPYVALSNKSISTRYNEEIILSAVVKSPVVPTASNFKWSIPEIPDNNLKWGNMTIKAAGDGRYEVRIPVKVLLKGTFSYEAEFQGETKNGSITVTKNPDAFDYIDETWNFGNSMFTDFYIPLTAYARWYSTAAAKKLHREDGYGLKGRCGGMVLSAISSWLGYPSVSSFGNYTCLNEVNKNDKNSQVNCSALDFIKCAHAYRRSEKWSSMYAQFLDRSTHQEAQVVYDAVRQFENGTGEPPYISVKDPAHALLGIEIFSETSTETKILVYDCNLPNQVSFLTLEGTNGNFTGWHYSSYSDEFGDENWSSAEDDHLTYVTMGNMFVTDYKLNWKQSSDYVLVSECETLNLMPDHEEYFMTGIDDSGGTESSYKSFWVDKGIGDLSFTDISGNGDISIASNDLILTVTPCEGMSFSINAEGKASFTNCAGKKVDVKYELCSDYENSMITHINGTSTGSAMTTRDVSGNIIFTGLKDCVITLDAAHEDNDGTTSFSGLDTLYLTNLDPSKEYKVFTVKENSSTVLEVYLDKDGDGNFETRVNRDEIETNTCGPNLTWELEDCVLTISGTGDMFDWSSSNNFNPPWDDEYYYIFEVIINDGVTSIGEDAFRSCVFLNTVTIPNSVTSIGDSAFEYCGHLTDITIPDSVTNIGQRAFLHCDSLTSVKIGNGVTRIGDFAFYSCSSIPSLTIPDSVTSIEDSAFSGCTSLNAITFEGDAPYFEYEEGGEDHSNALYGVTATAYYPAGNPTWTEDVMQDYGGNITWVPRNPSGVELYDNTLKLPENTTTIESESFAGLTQGVNIDVPDTVTSIDDDAFEGSKVVIISEAGGYVEEFCNDHEIPFNAR